ncbi:hypothetical protein AQUSIP_01230 [Aquicella siphonis]|uniref:Uncharacterized protein n=1 Tax=Aquicella siphonis TaxID=254247 RepID=A0A5E4PD71_9COXI|nr:Arm DNA-binding domain-containing protein [Aquicella siphonis]VVC74849.1 hypothetical protein AQUSIP_01230 [Aquicella siphonis]
MSKLTSKQIEHATSKAVEQRLADGSGLFLRVRASDFYYVLLKSWKRT